MDPFEEFMKKKREEEEAEKAKAAGLAVGDDESQQKISDETITWTGKRVRGYGNGSAGDDSGGSGGVGKYLKAALAERAAQGEDEIVEFVDEEPEPEHVRKKMKASVGRGGFGNFDTW